MDQLRLALKWDRADVAAEQLLTADMQWEMADLEEAMLEALLSNRVAFVQLLLQHGVVMRDFLTVLRLRKLYNAVCKSMAPVSSAHQLQTPRGGSLYKLLEEVSRGRNTFYLCDVKIVLEVLIEHSFEPTYDLDEAEKSVPNTLLRRVGDM